ncbi:MAG: hypothetical protein KKH98_11455 [Spirochaetes bacterium]|nr:hypothetical protein [Spirochaetota bacterium]
MKNKKFDAVKMMRKIRDNLSRKYADNPELEEKELSEIRKKYKIKEKQNRASG